MLPIGITFTVDKDFANKVEMEYIEAIERHGGLPIPLFARTEESWKKYFKMIKGLLLSGGGDVDPYYFSEEPSRGCGRISPERDKMEIELTKTALKMNLPVLGICRGAQVLNIACGGNIYQDLALKDDITLEHMQTATSTYPFHNVSISEGTLLFKITGKHKLRVNSFHHQAVKNIGQGLLVSAVADDGVIEAIESTLHPFALGVQWHAEALASGNRPGGSELFEFFLKAVEKDGQNALR